MTSRLSVSMFIVVHSLRCCPSFLGSWDGTDSGRRRNRGVDDRAEGRLPRLAPQSILLDGGQPGVDELLELRVAQLQTDAVGLAGERLPHDLDLLFGRSIAGKQRVVLDVGLAATLDEGLDGLGVGRKG